MTKQEPSISDATKEVFTACRYCIAVCGVKVTVDSAANRIVRVSPDKANPWGSLDFCANARTAREAVEHPRRLTSPMKRVGDRYVPASHEEAVEDIARRLNTIIDRYGPDAVGSYHGNPASMCWGNSVLYGGLLEAIGTKNRFWVGSVDHNSQIVVNTKLWNMPLAPLQIDIDHSDCMMLIGHNPAESSTNWYWSSQGGWGRITDRVAAGADLIVVDPRRTLTAQAATIHVPVRSGQDWAFLLGVLKVIFDNGWDRPATAVPVSGVDGLKVLAAGADLNDLSTRCDIPVQTIVDVARRFATARTAFCASATGVSQTRAGTVGEWLGWVLNLVTDRVDRPGGRRYERGLLDPAKVIGAWASTEHVSRVRGYPTRMGYQALAELPDEITTPGPGQIKAMVINAGNPVVSGPQGLALDAALAQLDLLVAVDLMQRESHRHAHWLIPAYHWTERSEMHPLIYGMPDKPFAQYWRAAVEPPTDLKDDWEFFTDLALAMGRDLFGKRGVNRFIRVSRALAKRTGRPGLAFDPDWIARLMVAFGRRAKWKDIVAAPHGLLYGEPRYGDFAAAIRTPDKQVHVDDAELLAQARALLSQPPARPPAGYPFNLTNRRRGSGMNSVLNDLPSLAKLNPTNRVELHPQDAADLGIAEDDLVEVSSTVGCIELPALLTDRVRRGSVCVDHGWGSRVFDPAGLQEPQSLGANRNLLVDNQNVDPISGMAALNDAYVAVRRAPGNDVAG